MLKNKIEVGSVYIAKVSNRHVKVRVDAIEEVAHGTGLSRTRYTRYDVTNLITNRKTVFRSAAKFRSVAEA